LSTVKKDFGGAAGAEEGRKRNRDRKGAREKWGQDRKSKK
jgi:hypothetical protein